MNNSKLIFKIDIINSYFHKWLIVRQKKYNKKIKKQVPIFLTNIIEKFCSMILSDIYVFCGIYSGELYDNPIITEKTIFKTLESCSSLAKLYLKLFPKKFMKNVYSLEKDKYNKNNFHDFSHEIIYLLKSINSKLKIDKSGLKVMNKILNLILEDLTTTFVFTETNRVFLTVFDLKNIIRCYFPITISDFLLS